MSGPEPTQVGPAGLDGEELVAWLRNVLGSEACTFCGATKLQAHGDYVMCGVCGLYAECERCCNARPRELAWEPMGPRHMCRDRDECDRRRSHLLRERG